MPNVIKMDSQDDNFFHLFNIFISIRSNIKKEMPVSWSTNTIEKKGFQTEGE